MALPTTEFRWACFCALASLAVQSATTRTDLDVRLEKIDAAAGTIHDLRGKFVQKKFSSLLTEPLVTQGEMRAKNGIMLWKTESPEAIRTRATPERLEIYYVRRGLIEQYPLHGALGELAASPIPRLTTLRSRFSIEPDSGDGLEPPERGSFLALKLLPIKDDMKRYVGSVRVLLDESKGVILRFELTDPDGERTLISFSDIETNTGFADSQTELGASKDVKTVRPLETGGR